MRTKNWNLVSDEPIMSEAERAVTDGERVGWRSIRWTQYGPAFYGPVYSEPRSVRVERSATESDYSAAQLATV